MTLARALFASLILLAAAAMAQTAPIPFLNQPLVPMSAAPGGSGFTLTVNGTSFVSTSVVNWNGSPRTTTFVSAAQLTAAISASDVATASTATITVTSPGPGGGVSNPLPFPIAAPRTTLSFSATTETAGNSPNSARIADLNGDGIADIIVPNVLGNTISVLLGNGNGTFRPHVDYATGGNPFDLTIADFNADGKLDLAVTNFSGLSNSVSILLGNGDGTFQTHMDYAAGIEPTGIAAGDLNGDGKLDLVVANNTSYGYVSVLLGNGDGTFQPYKTYQDAGGQGVCVALGDFNHDGILDIVTAATNPYSVSLLLGNGDGTFQPHVDFPAGSGTMQLAVADFDGDGNLDLAVSNYDSDSVSVLLGRGDGTFQSPVPYSTPVNPYDLTTADINGDGKIDLAVGTANPLAGVSLLLGNGDGTFQRHLDFDSGGYGPPSPGDFNNDGLLDFALASTGGAITFIQDHGTVVTLSPSTLAFSTQLVGTISSSQTLTLTNTGGSSITISSMALGTVNFAFAKKCPGTLPAGQSCTVLIYFTPTTQGNLGDTLSIFDTGGGSPQFVTLTGTATILSYSPKSLNFGSLLVGKTSSPLRVILTNDGGVKVSITQIAIVGADRRDFTEINACGTSLAAGTSCTIDLWFTPKAIGTRSASLTITDSGGASPQKISLSGSGT